MALRGTISKMKETYISLGTAITPITCFLSILTFALLFALLYLRKARQLPAATLFLVTTWNAACLWLLPPDAIHFAGLILSVGVGLVVDRKRMGTLKRIEAWFAALVLPVLAIGTWFILTNPYRQDVTIQDELLTQTGTFRGTVYAKRSDIRLHASKIATQSLMHSPGWSWTVFTNDDVGPEIRDNEVYFHNMQFVRGEELGKRIAKWAGVEPKYTLYKRDPNDVDKIVEASR